MCVNVHIVYMYINMNIHIVVANVCAIHIYMCLHECLVYRQ